MGRDDDERGHRQADQLLLDGSVEVVFPIFRSGYKQYAVCENRSGRKSLRRDVGGYVEVIL